jgi:Putative bacterial sensory transduction regulator
MINALTAFALASITAFSMAAAGAQTPKLNEAGVKAADPRIRTALEQLKIPFTIDNDGDFVIELKVDDKGRSQIVYISSKTDKPENLEWRELFSFAQKVDKNVDPQMAQKLLLKNSRLILGAWGLIQNKDGTGYVTFSTKVPADSPPEVLSEAINATLYSSDQGEKELTGKDEF